MQDVARGIGLDKRIGSKFLHAGPGYGGSCFPKDTLALMKTGAGLRRAGAHRRDRGRRSTTQRKRAMARKVIARAAAARCAARRSRVLGLTFKPNTDDMRDAPSLAIVAVARRTTAREVARLRSREAWSRRGR